MKLRQLRFFLGFLVLLTHLGYPFWLFFLRSQYLEVQQITEMTLMVMPVLAVSLVVVIRMLMRDEVPDDTHPVRLEKALVSLLVALAFIITLYGVPLLHPRPVESINTLRSTLLICDTLFGAYLGYIIDEVFVPKARKPRKAATAPSDAVVKGGGKKKRN